MTAVLPACRRESDLAYSYPKDTKPTDKQSVVKKMPRESAETAALWPHSHTCAGSPAAFAITFATNDGHANVATPCAACMPQGRQSCLLAPEE